ncbi:MAG: TAXI family TRAP transporter solute-binding subunit [Alphaproteobacteria bacterium]
MAWVAAVCCLLLAQTAVLAQPADRQVYSLGTATTEGVSHPIGVTLAALIKLKLLPRANIDLDARNTEGSRSNALQLREAKLDFAILSSFDAYHAARGTGPFADAGPDETLRFLTNLWTSAFYFVTRNDLAPTGGFDDFLNLKGRPVALGAVGSDLRNQADALFAEFDVDIDASYRLEDLPAQDAAQAFLDGDIDGFLLVDDRQGADIDGFLDRAGDQAVVLVMSDAQLGAIERGGAQPWTRAVVPANTLRGQPEEQSTIGLRYLLATSERVSEEAVYQITKTIFDNLPFLQEMHAATVGIGLETALDQLSLPVHAGAADYYTEVGITLPEPEPIRISTLSKTPFLKRYDTALHAREQLSDSAFTMIGGGEGETVTRMISELADSFDDSDVRVQGIITPRPAENIADILYARGVDSAIVPLSILNYAREQNVYPDLARKIAYATELFTEEVHLVVRDGIDKIEDLIDQPVSLGPPGSISEFTAAFLLDKLNLPVEPTHDDPRTALARLAEGDLAGVFLVSGKPMPLLAEIPADAGLRLLPVPTLEGEAYRPATLSAADYPNLLADGAEIETFALRTLLLGYNWPADNPRFLALSTFTDRFFQHLPIMQEADRGFHAKWREIDPQRSIEGWVRSPAAVRSLQGRNGNAPVTPLRSDG